MFFASNLGHAEADQNNRRSNVATPGKNLEMSPTFDYQVSQFMPRAGVSSIPRGQST
jgi:hypothetical protein